MKKLLLCAFAATGLIAGCAATVGDPVDIDKMSLEQTSPFEVPTPDAFELNAGLYRETQLGAPAMIPHAIDNYPITKDRNSCLMCHGNTAKIDAPKVKGQPTAMPSTHWTKVDGKLVMQPSRHECTLCHAPQANVQPLVETTH